MNSTQHFLAVLLLTLSIAVHPIDLKAQNNPDPLLTRVTAVRDSYPFWSPDGNQIVFQSDRSGVFEIYIINTDGSGLKRITRRKELDETPVWSPDGNKILFSSYVTATDEDNELFIMNVDGTCLKRLTHSPGRDGHPKFSRDGSKIIFCSERDEPGGYEIYEMDTDGMNTKRLTFLEGWDTYPEISPDGGKIVWRRLLPEGGNSSTGSNSEIFIMNRDGSNPVNLTDNPDFDGYPAWSPDGGKIAFASNRDRKADYRGNLQLFIMNPDGSGVTKLLDNLETVEDARPVWSPNGTRILFNRQYIADESSIDIMILDVPEEFLRD